MLEAQRHGVLLWRSTNFIEETTPYAIWLKPCGLRLNGFGINKVIAHSCCLATLPPYILCFLCHRMGEVLPLYGYVMSYSIVANAVFGAGLLPAFVLLLCSLWLRLAAARSPLL